MLDVYEEYLPKQNEKRKIIIDNMRKSPKRFEDKLTQIITISVFVHILEITRKYIIRESLKNKLSQLFTGIRFIRENCKRIQFPQK